jgi:ribonuclease P protein component
LVVTRYIGGAVVRNRAKRRIREVFRRIKSHLCETADIVIRARGPIRQASYQEIAYDLQRLLIRQKFLDASFPDHGINDS